MELCIGGRRFIHQFETILMTRHPWKQQMKGYAGNGLIILTLQGSKASSSHFIQNQHALMSSFCRQKKNIALLMMWHPWKQMKRSNANGRWPSNLYFAASAQGLKQPLLSRIKVLTIIMSSFCSVTSALKLLLPANTLLSLFWYIFF